METVKYIVVFVLIFSEFGDAKRNRNRQTQQDPPEETPASQPETVREAACTTTCGGDSVLDQSTCRCSCPKGYTYNRDRQRCEDVNECGLYPERCLGTCTNTVGSFICRCPADYVLHKNGWDCKAVPKVLACRGLVCFDGSRLNVVSCRCECGQGKRYNFFTEQCDDINECITGNHGCLHGCINIPRGYQCYCASGYELLTDMRTCVQSSSGNVELPCNGKQCGANSALDAYHCQCECQIGYHYDVTEEACLDIDECIEFRGWCEGTCTNNVGSYTCVCTDGLQLNDDGWTCSPIPTPESGSDLVCGKNEFKCANGELCVQESVICDGHNDCGDRSDEPNCKPLCGRNQFQCANGDRCLEMSDICDSENDCLDFSDEVNCKCQDEKLQCRAWQRRGECNANPGWMNWNCRLTCEVCLPTDGVPSGKLSLHTDPEAFYIRNSHEYAKTMQWTLRNSGERPGNVGNQWSCDTITTVPDDIKETFRLSGLYEKYTEAFKIPILGLSVTDDDALRRACYVIRFMLGDRRDLRQVMYKKWGRVVIMGKKSYTQMVPEHSQTDRILRNTRGLGGTLHIPVTSVGEENLLCQANDIHRKEDNLVHNFAHAMHKIGITVAQPDFQERLAMAYNKARRKEYWENSKADDTVEEYFAEGVQAFFNVQAPYAYGVHNDIDNRDKLGRYDPELYDLIIEVFPCMNYIVDRCADQGEIVNQPMKMNCRDAHRARLRTTQPSTTPIPRNNEDLPPDCQDSDGDCFDWALLGECEENPGWMHINCRRSCRSCLDENDDPNCRDDNESCEGWALDGECKVNPNWMMTNCRRSCDNCPDHLECYDNSAINCNTLATDGECATNLRYMESNCRRTCNFC